MLPAAAAITWATAAGGIPSARALRTPAWTAPSRRAPTAAASLTSRSVGPSSGPSRPASAASRHASASFGKRRTNSWYVSGGSGNSSMASPPRQGGGRSGSLSHEGHLMSEQYLFLADVAREVEPPADGTLS